MIPSLRPALTLAIGMLLVTDLAAAGRLENAGPVVPVNVTWSETRLAAIENEIASLKSSLAHDAWHVGDSPCPKPAGWFASVDYLYWKARRDMLDYATFDPDDEDIPQGPLVSLAFGGKSGVRGRLRRSSMCGWDFGVVYTYFHTSVRDAVSVPTGSNELTPILSSPYGASLLDVDRASASADLDYSVFDFEIGYPWYVENTLTGRRFASFRWAGTAATRVAE